MKFLANKNLDMKFCLCRFKIEEFINWPCNYKIGIIFFLITEPTNEENKNQDYALISFHPLTCNMHYHVICTTM